MHQRTFPINPFQALYPGQTAHIPDAITERRGDPGPMLLIVTAPAPCGLPGCEALVVHAVEIVGEMDRIFHRLPHRPVYVIRSAA